MKDYTNWWYCDNVVSPTHKNQIGLLYMGEPQVFILIRNSLATHCTFDEFCDEVAEINFLHPEDRENADLETLLTDAWNFLALQEQADEDAYYEALSDDGNL